MKKLLSYILPVSLIAGIGVLGALRVSRGGSFWESVPVNGDAALALCYILWVICEATLFRHDGGMSRAADRGTRELYAAAQGLTILSALWFSPVWLEPGPVHIAGFLLFASGITFRLWAVFTLGRFYSHSVRLRRDHRVVQTGPYRFVRHPAYAGMIAAHAGAVLFWFSAPACAAWLLLLIPSILLRISVEEKTLNSMEGYARYAAARKRLVPFLW